MIFRIFPFVWSYVNNFAWLLIPADNALNTIRLAKGIGYIDNKSYSFNDYVGDYDSADFYMFFLNAPSQFTATLSGLGADADIQLIQDLNNNGEIDAREILGISTQGGTTQDSISRYLDAGVYYVRVAPYSGNTAYNLNLQATNLSTPDYTDPSLVPSYFGTNVTRAFYNNIGASTYQSQYGTFLMYGAVANYYSENYFYAPNAKNGLFGVYAGLGLPTTPIYIQADGAEVMEFEGGTLTNRNGVVTPYYYQKNGDRFDLVGQGAPDGAELLWKNDYAYWNRGSIGQPIGPVRRIDGGWEQSFTGSPRGDGDAVFLLKDNQVAQGGIVNGIPNGGPYRVSGEFLNIYRSVGYTDAFKLGFPTMSQGRSDYNGFKNYQAFERGFIAQTYGDDRYVVQILGRTIWTSTSLDVNQSVSGQLNSTDVKDANSYDFVNSYSDPYRLTGLVYGQKYKAILTSNDFAPALVVFHEQSILTRSLFVTNGNTAEVEFVVGEYDYRINATSIQSGVTGNYTLTIVPVTALPVGSYGKTLNLGTLPVYQSLVDATNNGPVDYKFSLSSNSNLGVLVSGLSSDVLVSLLRDNGNNSVTLLEQSDKAGTSDESINSNLEAGNYILRISGNSTRFNLALSSSVAGQQTIISYSEFIGTVINMSVLLNIRSGPGTGYNDIGDLQSGNQLVFDGWTYGSVYKDITGQQQNQWFRIKGTNNWVAGAYVVGNPTQNTPYIDPSSSSPTNPGNPSGATNVDGTIYYNGQTVYDYSRTQLIRTGAPDPRAGVESTTYDQAYTGSVWTIIEPERGNEGKQHLVTITWGNWQWEDIIVLLKGGVAIEYEKKSQDNIPRTVTVRAIPNNTNAAQVITKETKITNQYGNSIANYPAYIDIRNDSQHWSNNVSGVPTIYTLFRDEDVDRRKNVDNVDSLKASGDDPNELKNNIQFRQLMEYLGGKSATSSAFGDNLPTLALREAKQPSIGGYLDRYYDEPGDGFHTGFDILFAGGTEIKSLVGGKVIFTGGTYGVVAIHNEVLKKTFLYLHMSNIQVKMGDFVNAGKFIGKVSDVGAEGNIHLHFEVQDDAELESLVTTNGKEIQESIKGGFLKSYPDSQNKTFYTFPSSINRSLDKSYISARMDNPLNAFIEAKALELTLDQPRAISF